MSFHSFMSDPYMAQYMGQMGLGLMAAGQAQPPGVNRYSVLMQAYNQANQGLMRNQLFGMQMKDREERKIDKEAKKKAMSTLVGGLDPTTDITWNEGRAGMEPGEQMGLLAQASPDAFAKAQIDQLFAPQKDRPTIKGADGFNYYKDSLERVLPGIKAKPDKLEKTSAITLYNAAKDQTISLDRTDPRLKQYLQPGSGWVEETRQKTGAISATRVDKIREQYDSAGRALSTIDEAVAAIEEKRSRAGLGGVISKFTQETLGIAGDLADMGIDVEKVRQVAQGIFLDDVRAGKADPLIGKFFDEKIADMDVWENRLAYQLARIRKGSGRLNVPDVENARSDVNMRGLKSVDAVLARLRTVRKEFEKSRGELADRIGEQQETSKYSTMSDEELKRVLGID